MKNRAAFLDRDGTIIDLVHHLTDPGDVRLIDGAGAAIRRLRAAGWKVIVITNQSVIGRGKLTEDGLAKVHAVMDAQLAEHETQTDGLYFCPLAPTQKDQRVIEDAMRKPGPGMLLQAARDHDIDLSRSWMVGDSLSDVLAGRNAGCKSLVVRTGYGNKVTTDFDAEAPTLAEAANIILNEGKSS
jgi:D-glycero-D-manno-heptose 1,7-bisphosphate phosphatase